MNKESLSKKIIIVGPAYPYRGGIADTNESFCRALVQEGHDASIYTFTLQYPKLLFPGKTQYSTEDSPKDLNISRELNSINPFNWRQVVNKLNKAKPDIVIFRFWIPFIGMSMGWVANKLDPGIKRIAMCDNIIPHEQRPGDKALTQFFVKQFDAFITMSKKVLDELSGFTSKPKKFFPHPINDNLGDVMNLLEARKHLKLAEDGKYLLFFGLVRKYKGLDLILEALSHLEDKRISLLVVGEFYEDKEVYNKIIRDNNLEDRVIIHDAYIPSTDIKYYFSAADLVTQTYHTASQSGVTQIAYNFNCPILVTNVGGLAEVVRHGELGYVTSKDPIDIAKSIEDYFDNNRREVFSYNVEREKEKYSWKTFSNELLDLASGIT